MSQQITERRQILSKNCKFDFLGWARFQRSEELSDSRKKNRVINIDAKRKMPHIVPVPPAKFGERVAKWKNEKLKAATEEKKCEKPVFKTGIVQRKVTGSPLFIMTDAYARKNFLIPDQIEKVNKAKKLCFGDEFNKVNTNPVQNVKHIKTALPQSPKNELKQNKTNGRNLVKSKSAPVMKTNQEPVKNMKSRK